MNIIFNKFNLIDNRTLEYEINQSEFMNRLRVNTVTENISFFGFFDFLDFSNKLYFGEINQNEFRIRKRNKLFSKHNFAVTYLKLRNRNGKTLIDITTKGYNLYMSIWYTFAIFFIIFINFIAIKDGQYQMLLITLLFTLFFLGFPIFMMKKRLKSFISELERDLYFICKK